MTRRFRHVTNYPGRAPTQEEVDVYNLVAAQMADESTPLPRVVAVGPGLAAVFVSETWDSEKGEACVVLAVEMGGTPT